MGEIRDRHPRDLTLQELDELLAEWKKWCFWHDEAIGPEAVGCASIEHCYISPQCWWAPEPRQEPPLEWKGMRVEKSVQTLPERPRAVLRMEFLGIAVLNGKRRRAFRESGDSPEQLRMRKRRALQMSQWDYDETLYQAKIMLKNIIGSTTNKR